MEDSPTNPGFRVQRKPPKNNNERRNLLTVAALAFLIGLAFALFIATVLWSFGYLYIGQSPCPEAKSACPQTAESLPVCPTCGVTVVTATPTFTPSPTATATPDIQATATAACQDFSEQFPLTPCPPLEPTATP